MLLFSLIVSSLSSGGLAIVPLHLEIGPPAVQLGGFDAGMPQEILDRHQASVGIHLYIFTKAFEGGGREDNLLKSLEAATGFEPVNNGFAVLPVMIKETLTRKG